MTNEDLPRGAGDPDTYGYPAEHDQACKLRLTGKGPDCDCSFSQEPDNG